LKASQHQAERKPRKAWRKRFLVWCKEIKVH
jgi:hypothetical protein